MKLRYVLLVAVSLALCICYSATAIDVQQRDWSGFNNLTLEVSIPKESYLQLQPIPLILTLSNKSPDSINGHSVLDFGAGLVEVWTRSGGADWRAIADLTVEKRLVTVKPREIKPGEEVSVNQLLSLRIEKVFPEPGTYQLKVKLYNFERSESVESQPVILHIKRPEGADLEAYNFIHTNANPDFFFTGKRLGRDRRDEQSLETFVAVFGETSYGDDASFVLGRRRFYGGNLEAARVHFEKLEKKQDFVFAKPVKEYLEAIKEKNKQ